MQIKFYQDQDSGTWNFNGQTTPVEHIIMLENLQSESVNFKSAFGGQAFSFSSPTKLFAADIHISDIIKQDGSPYGSIDELKIATAGFFSKDAKPALSTILYQPFIPAIGQTQFLVTKFTLTDCTILSGGADQTDNCIIAGQLITFDGAIPGALIKVLNTKIAL